MSRADNQMRLKRPQEARQREAQEAEDTIPVNDPKQPREERIEDSAEEHDVDGMDAGDESVDVQDTQEQLKKVAINKLEAEEMTEQTLWQGTYSLKALYSEWALIGVVLALLIGGSAFFGILGATWFIWLGLGALALAYGFIKAFYYKYSRMYRLTTQRVIHEKGLVFRTTDRIEVIDIDDVSFNQGPIERMLGIGTITIISSDRTSPELVIRGIDNVASVTNQMDAMRRKERLRRGVHLTN
jgi:membrane protein YdbS with pleckstrin-like domain